MSRPWDGFSQGTPALIPLPGRPRVGSMRHSLGYQYLGVELEPRFCAIAHGCDCEGDIAKHAACIDDQEHGLHHITGNLELWQRRYGHLPQWVPPILLQGDSRFLTEVLASAGLSVSSPPHTNRCVNENERTFHRFGQKNGHNEGDGTTYGSHPGQLGNLPSQGFETIISSPTYGNGCTHTGGIDPKPQHIQGGTIHHVHYGEQPAQLGNLPSEGFETIISSPAYGGNAKSDYLLSTDGKTRRRDEKRGYQQGHGCFRGSETYGETAGQLGREAPTTFWEAAAAIVSQVYAVLRPGGHAIWVTKNYIRDSAIVPFNDQWQRLCEAVGFRTLHIHHAMQVDHHEETGLFGEPATMYHKEYKGHFRRDNERKGAPKIDYEVVLCLVKDSKEDGNGFGISIASSPYANGTVHEGSGIDPTKVQGNRPGRHSQIYAGGYGQHPAQLGNMPAGQPPARED